MGWTGGSDIFDKVAPVVTGQVRDEVVAATILGVLFEALMDHGWDTEDESLGLYQDRPAVAQLARNNGYILENEWQDDSDMGGNTQSTNGYVRCLGCGRHQRYYRDRVDGDWGESYSMPHAAGENACRYMGLSPFGEGVSLNGLGQPE